MNATFLRLGGNDVSSINIEWLDGPQDIVLMLKLDKDGTISEPILTDGVPEIGYLYDLPHNPNAPREGASYVVGLVTLKNTSYVFTRNVIRLSRTVNIETVLGIWIGATPTLAIVEETDEKVG